MKQSKKIDLRTKLQRIKAKKGFTNDVQLARAIGAHPMSVNRWMNGASEPLPVYLDRINALDKE